MKYFSVLPGDDADARQDGQDDGEAELRPGVLHQDEVNADQVGKVGAKSGIPIQARIPGCTGKIN